MKLLSFRPSIGDLVSVSYKGHHYPAKILDFRAARGPPKDKAKKEDEYFVHYIRWNKKWDEWVPISRISKENQSSDCPNDKKEHGNDIKVTNHSILPSVIEIPKHAKRKRSGLVEMENSHEETALSSSAIHTKITNADAQAALKLLELAESKKVPKISKATNKSTAEGKHSQSKKVVTNNTYGFCPDGTIAVPRKRRNTEKEIFTASSSVQSKMYSLSTSPTSSSFVDTNDENSVTTVQGFNSPLTQKNKSQNPNTNSNLNPGQPNQQVLASSLRCVKLQEMVLSFFVSNRVNRVSVDQLLKNINSTNTHNSEPFKPFSRSELTMILKKLQNEDRLNLANDGIIHEV